MKHLLLIIFFQPLLSNAQPYALLHRHLLHPVEVTAQLESDKIAGHYFPIQVKDLEDMMKMVSQYIDSIDQNKNGVVETEIKLGYSRLFIRRSGVKKMGCSVFLFTRAKDHGFTFDLVQARDNKRRALQKMKTFLDYLRNNHFLVKEKIGALPFTAF